MKILLAPKGCTLKVVLPTSAIAPWSVRLNPLELQHVETPWLIRKTRAVKPNAFLTAKFSINVQDGCTNEFFVYQEKDRNSEPDAKTIALSF